MNQTEEPPDQKKKKILLPLQKKNAFISTHGEIARGHEPAEKQLQNKS